MKRAVTVDDGRTQITITRIDADDNGVYKSAYYVSIDAEASTTQISKDALIELSAGINQLITARVAV